MSEPEIDPVSDLRAKTEDLERQLAALQKDAGNRVIRAEMKAEAIRAGMIDLDGLKLLDLSRLSLGEDGDVLGGSQAIAQLKRAKPWLFGGTSSSSSVAAPPARSARPKLATEMTEEEYREARSALLRRYT
jgi:hypothetical protein